MWRGLGCKDEWNCQEKVSLFVRIIITTLVLTHCPCMIARLRAREAAPACWNYVDAAYARCDRLVCHVTIFGDGSYDGNGFRMGLVYPCGQHGNALNEQGSLSLSSTKRQAVCLHTSLCTANSRTYGSLRLLSADPCGKMAHFPYILHGAHCSSCKTLQIAAHLTQLTVFNKKTTSVLFY